MKISPNFSEVKKIAAIGKYNILPISCEILSDFTTPIETMKILKNVSTHCYMLESAYTDDKWGRYTFLGFYTKLDIENPIIRINTAFKGCSSLEKISVLPRIYHN